MPKIGSQNSTESPKRRHNRPAVLWDAVSSIGDFIGTPTAEDCVRLVSLDSPTQITVERGYQSSLIIGTPGPCAFRIRVKKLSPINGFAACRTGHETALQFAIGESDSRRAGICIIPSESRGGGLSPLRGRRGLGRPAGAGC